MFITPTEVTVYSNISATAGTIAAGTWIEDAEERLGLITNNYFQTGIDVQSDLTFNATALTINASGINFTTEGFKADDIIYIYGSYRNDKYVKISTVSSSTLTCVTGTTIVTELSGASILLSVCQFPNALKYTLAQMVKYDYDDRTANAQNLKSHSLGPFSETFTDQSDNNIQTYGYPGDIIGQLAPYSVVRLY